MLIRQETIGRLRIVVIREGYTYTCFVATRTDAIIRRTSGTRHEAEVAYSQECAQARAQLPPVKSSELGCRGASYL